MNTIPIQMQSIDSIDLMSDPRDASVFVRLTEKEKKDVQRLAKTDRRKVADWVRGVILDEVSRRKRAILEQKSDETSAE